MTNRLYIQKLNLEQKRWFNAFNEIIEGLYPEVKVRLITGHPYYYLDCHEDVSFHEKPYIAIAFFHNHVNIFSCVNQEYISLFEGYHFTDKYTLQINLDQKPPFEALKELFKHALMR